jgi:16S rRNA (cytosine1402-N4)-methyltransferase
MYPHTPVLLEEVLHYLNPQKGGRFIDATVGAGGHAAAILESTAPDGRLLAIDQDADALRLASETLKAEASRITFVQANFREIAQIATSHDFLGVDGILADLGVSSMMLDQAERGFSFRLEGPLDMRMDKGQQLTAADIVNHASERELADIIYRFGEERRSRPLARSIVRYRPHHTTGDLVRAIESVTGKPRYGRIHPATRTFMALRLVVNRELENLEAFLQSAVGVLKQGGRLVIVSFHSLEDRIVKQKMRELGGVLTRKVVRAGEVERGRNPRARSARLRALEKNQ